MKFVISFFLSLNAFSAPINIFHEGSSSETYKFKNILINDYQIPEGLMSIKKTKKCNDQRSEGKLDICIKKDGDLLLVSVDREFIEESLKVFQAQ
jgi:hypothetical protein